jgi:hypothetical protein
MWTVRIIGGLLLLLAVICGLLILANWHTASLGGRSLTPLALPAALFCILGIGMLFRRKSAALIVVLGSVAWAVWLFIGTARLVPMPWSLMNVVAGIVVLVPAVLVVKKWNALVGW